MHRKSRKWTILAIFILLMLLSTVALFEFHQWQQERIKNQKLQTGLQSYKDCKWKSAASNLGKYLSFCPRDTEILLKYADAQLHIRPLGQDNIQQAIAAYRTIIRADKQNKKAVLELANVYLLTGAPTEAENITYRYLTHQTDNEIKTIYAISLFRQRKFLPASEILKEIIADCPNTINAYGVLANISKSNSEGQFETAEYWLNECVKNNPQLANSYIMRASYYLDKNKYLKAVDDINTAEHLDLPDANARIELARQYIRADIPEKAKEHLRIAEKCDPTNISLWIEYAETAIYDNSKEDMRTTAERAMIVLEKDPWDFMPIAAELFIRCGEINKAETLVEQLKLNEINPAAVKWLEGLQLQAQGRDYEAIKKWHIAEKMGYNSEKITPEMLNEFVKAGNNESALILLRRKTIEEPERFKWHYLLAQLALDEQLYSEALSHSNKALSLRPNSIESYILNAKIRIYLPTGSKQITKCENLTILSEQLSKLSTLPSNDIEIELLKFKCKLECEEYEKAEEIITKLQQSYPQQMEIETAFVDLLMAKNQNEEAEDKLFELIDIFPQKITPVLYLSNILINTDKNKECENVILAAIERIEERQSKRKLAIMLANIYDENNEKEKERLFLTRILKTIPEDIPIRKVLAQLYIDGKQYSKTQTIIDEIKEIEGGDGLQWKYMQAKLWSLDAYFEKYYPQATTLLQEILSENPYDNNSRLLLASVYEKASESQLALITYRAALNQRPQDIEIKTHIIDNLFKVKEYDTAQTFLDDAIKQDYVNGDVLKLNLRNLLRQNRVAEAIEFIEKIDVPEENRQNLDQLTACLKIKMKDYEGANKILDSLSLQDPNSFEINSLLVELYLRTNNFQQALDICDQMAKENKKAVVLLLRGQAYTAMGNYDLAQKDYDDAVNMEPNNADTFEARGLFYRTVGQYDSAFKDLEKAYQLQLSNIDIIKYMLNSLTDMNNPQDVWKCQQLLKHALINYPKEPELLWYKARLLIAEDKLPSTIRAENILEEVTKNNPRFSSGWSLLAEVYLNQNKTSKAMNTILEGLRNCGNDKILLLLKAKAEMSSSPEMAILTLEHLSKRLPEDIEIKLLLANTYADMGQTDKAIELLQNYEQQCPD